MSTLHYEFIDDRPSCTYTLTANPAVLNFDIATSDEFEFSVSELLTKYTVNCNEAISSPTVNFVSSFSSSDDGFAITYHDDDKKFEIIVEDRNKIDIGT